LRAIEIAIAVARRMALSAHGHTFHKVLSPNDVGRHTGGCARLRLGLGKDHWDLIRNQRQSNDCGGCKKNKMKNQTFAVAPAAWK
jgi:hypothetical protein